MIAVDSLVPYLGGALAIGGLSVAISGRRELMLRWCAWTVAVPVLTAAFWWGRPGIALLAVGAGLIAVAEYGALVRLPRLDRVILAAAFTCLVVATWRSPEEAFRVGAIGALAIVAVPLVAGDAVTGLHRAMAGLWGLAWLGVLAGMVTIGTEALVLFVAVSVGDIVASFAGRGMGGPRLSPLSPAKRWSGSICGAAAGLSTLALLAGWSLPMALAVAVGGPAGDLLESMVKRGSQAKDSGTWLAGAGGLLDRIDSLLVSLAVLLVVR